MIHKTNIIFRSISAIIILSFMVTNNSYTQDVLLKRDGTTQIIKVLEINETQIKYNKFNNLEGPIYTIATNDVSRINYENGTFDEFLSTIEIESTAQNISSTNIIEDVIIDLEKFNISFEKNVKLPWNIDPPKGLVISNDDKKVAVYTLGPGTKDLGLHIWNLEIDKLFDLGYKFDCDGARFLIDFSDDGEQFYLITSCYNIIFWDTETGKQIKQYDLKNKSNLGTLDITKGGFKYDSKSDKILVKKNTLLVHAGKSNEFIANFPDKYSVQEILSNKIGTPMFDGNKDYEHFVLGPNNKYIAGSPMLSKTLTIWDAESGRVLNTRKEDKGIYQIQVSQNSKYVIAEGLRNMTLYDVDNNFSAITFQPFEAVASGFATIGDYIVVCGNDKKSPNMFRVFNYDRHLEKTIEFQPQDTEEPVIMSFTSSGDALFSVDFTASRITMWKVEK